MPAPDPAGKRSCGQAMMGYSGPAGRLVVAFFLLGLVVAPAVAGGWNGRVVHVSAGDRLLVDSGSGPVAVRLAHVRAPAREHFFWERARRALGELVFDRRVVVMPVQSGAGRARVLVDGGDVAAQLVERGLLLVAPGATDDLLARQGRARRQGRGIWGSGVPPPTR